MRDGNAYDEFIAYLQQKVETVSVQNVLVQKHHILPFHDGGLVNGETVVCSLKDHAMAHLIRYQVYGQIKDKIAALFIGSQTEEAVKLKQELIVSTNRERKNTFFNPTWQKIQANKPKST
jgi:hypothetical protein